MKERITSKDYEMDMSLKACFFVSVLFNYDKHEIKIYTLTQLEIYIITEYGWVKENIKTK